MKMDTPPKRQPPQARMQDLPADILQHILQLTIVSHPSWTVVGSATAAEPQVLGAIPGSHGLHSSPRLRRETQVDRRSLSALPLVCRDWAMAFRSQQVWGDVCSRCFTACSAVGIEVS